MDDGHRKQGLVKPVRRQTIMNRWNVIPLEPRRGLGSHAVAWDALNKSLFNSHPMLDSRFIDELLIHYGSGRVVLCVLNPNDAPQAMCLLRSIRPGLWSTFLPSQAQIGPMLLSDPVHIPFLLPKLPGYALRVDMLCVDPAFSNFKMNDPLLVNRMDHALTMNVSLSGTFEEYWASRPKKLAQNIGRYMRRVQSDALEQRLVRITDASGLSAAVDRYARLESKGWKGKEGTALGSNDNQQKFYANLLLRYELAQKEAMVYELWLGETLVASRLIIGQGNMFAMLKTTFDEALSRYAPGRLLLYLVMQDLFKHRTGKNIEFYTDADTDQLAWATGQRWISHWTFHRNAASVLFNSLIGAASGALKSLSSAELEAGNEHTIGIYRRFDDLPDEVRDFFLAAESEDFQFGLAWYQNLTATVFADDEGVYIFSLRREEKVIACIPVLIRKGKLGFEVESLGNFYTTLYSPAVAPNVRYLDLVVLVKAIAKAFEPLTSMRFSSMDPDSIGYRRLKNALHAAGFADFGYFCFGNWYRPQPGDWKTYLAGLRGTTRSTIKRMSKKFSDAGGTLRIVTDATDLAEALAAYEQVYALSWKVVEPFPKFIPGLVNLSKDKGWLRLGVARLEGRPVAAQLWIVANGKANIYKLAYDEGFKAYAPGTVLTATMMEHVIEQDQVTEVDFLAGDDPYKRFWMSDRRERWGVIAYNPKTIAGIFGLSAEVLGRALRPFIDRSKMQLTKLLSQKPPVVD